MSDQGQYLKRSIALIALALDGSRSIPLLCTVNSKNFSEDTQKAHFKDSFSVYLAYISRTFLNNLHGYGPR